MASPCLRHGISANAGSVSAISWAWTRRLARVFRAALILLGRSPSAVPSFWLLGLCPRRRRQRLTSVISVILAHAGGIIPPSTKARFRFALLIIMFDFALGAVSAIRYFTSKCSPTPLLANLAFSSSYWRLTGVYVCRRSVGIQPMHSTKARSSGRRHHDHATGTRIGDASAGCPTIPSSA